MSSQPMESNSNLTLLRRMDAACLSFENGWLTGGRPALEPFLVGFEEPERAEVLTELLLLEWSYLLRRGESFDSEEYARRFPELRPAVEEARQRWKVLDRRAGTTELPGYEQVAPLGRGGMGEVFKAFDPRLKRWVAIKQVRLDKLESGLTARFRIEARALATLTHPHIVKVFEYMEQNGQPVLVMEHIAGGTLEQRLKRSLRAGEASEMPLAESARLVSILAWAVHAAHEKGIVHRDLKPTNVLMDEPVAGSSDNVLDGYPKVSDFGLAVQAGEGIGQTVSGAVLGTPDYMAPEQAAGKTREVGPKADVWALGVILYRCLTGSLPFSGDSVLDTLERVKTIQFRPVLEVCPETPNELVEACMSCLKKPLEERPAAAELAAALDRYLASSIGPTVDFTSKTDRSRRLVLGSVLGGAALIAVIVAVMLAVWPNRDPGKGDPAVKDRSEEVAALLQVKMTVRVFDGADPKRKPWLSIDRPDALPVRAGELVRTEVELDRPMCCYLLLLSSQSEVAPLYPWNESKLKVKDVDSPPGGQAVRKWSSPTLPEAGWKVDRHAGLETLLLLVRDEPLPAGFKLSQLLGEVPGGKRAPLRDRRELAILELDRADEDAQSLLSQGRGFESEAAAVDEPLVALMRRAKEVFPVVRAVRFAHTAD